VVLRACSVVLCVLNILRTCFAVRILRNMNFICGMKLKFDVLYICDFKC
jgi:hypothetical protein